MPTFETLPRFEKDWKGLTPQQRDTFRKVVKDAGLYWLLVNQAPPVNSFAITSNTGKG